MNKIFKKKWSRARRCFVAVSEVAKSITKSSCKSMIVGVAAMAVADPALASHYVNAGENFVVNGTKLSVEKMTNNGTITNNGGEIVWYGDREGNYWNGNGDIVGDGTGQVKFVGNRSTTPIQINQLNDQAYIEFSVSDQTINIGSINSPNAFVTNRVPNANGSISYHFPTLLINGDVLISNGYINPLKGQINGDLIADGTFDKTVLLQWLEGGFFGHLLEQKGVIDLGGRTEFGGMLVKGNVTAPFLIITGSKNSDFAEGISVLNGTTIVEGDVTTDNLVIGDLGFDLQSDLLKVKGVTTVSENLYNDGLMNLGKTVVNGTFFNGYEKFRGTESIIGDPFFGAEITQLETPEIVNWSNLKVVEFLKTSGVKVTQNDGQIQSTANWLDNSTITLIGGILDSDNFGTEKSLGANNTYTVTGGTLATKNLGTGSTVAVSDTGILQSNVETVFDNYEAKEVALNVIGFSGETTQLLSEVLTERFKNYTPGTLTDAFEKSVSFDGGKLVLKNVNLTENAKADLEKSFKSKFESATIEFQGNISGTSKTDILNVSKVNELYENVGELKDVIYVDKALQGENALVKVGNADGSLKYNTGFVSVDNATGVEITDGKELLLLGEKSDTDRKVLADSVSATGAGSTLSLGSKGIADSQNLKGSLAKLELADSGKLKVNAGDFVINDFSATKGIIETASGTNLRLDKAVFDDRSQVVNNGKVTVGTLSSKYLTNITNNNNFVVEGKTEFSGVFDNRNTLQFKDTATIVGTLQNQKDGNLYAKKVDVIGALVNYGYMEASDESTVNGRLENPGKIVLHGLVVNKGNGLDQEGMVANTHVLEGTGTTFINGLLSNAPGAQALFNKEDSVINIEEGGKLKNEGTLIGKVENISGSLVTTDLAVVDQVKSDYKGEVIVGGTLLTNTMNTDGKTHIQKDADVVLGAAQQERYLLKHLDQAERIVDAGGAVSQEVFDAVQDYKAQKAAEGGEEVAVLSLRKAPRMMALRAVADDEATSDEVKVEGENAETSATDETNEAPAKEEAKAETPVQERAVVVAPEPVQVVTPRLVPSLQGAVASMSIVSMTQDAGFLETQALTKGNGLWADVGTGNIEFDGYKGNRSGLFFGGQANVNENVLIGAAMRYTDGRIKGNGLDKRDWSGYGIGFYGSYNNNGWFGLATASYQSNRAKDKGRVESDSFALSVKGGKSIEAGNFTVTPYVGYRMIRVDTDYADKATVHQIPIGVKVQGNAKAGDWIINPSIDAAFVPQMGDRKIGLKGTGLQSTVTSRYAGEARVGLSASKGNLGAGLYYVGSSGDKGLRSHSVQTRINYNF